MTSRGNKYLLTFIDNFSKYVEAFPIPDVSAETCGRVFAKQIIARHGGGSTLFTNQGSSFTSAFFQETCKILKVRKVRTSAYHAMSNGTIERVHEVLYDSRAHYTDSTGTNWDVVLPFFLMDYRATPHSTTGFSPFYLLHGREMVLQNEGDLKAKISPNIQDVDQVQRLENLESTLMKAYKEVSSITGNHTRRTRPIMTRKLRRGNLRLMIRFICFALLGSPEGVISLDRSGKDLLWLCRKCLI